MKQLKKVSAFAPATVANVAVGFDILGFSFGVCGDTVSLEKISEKKIIIESEFSEIPLDPQKNTATAGLLLLMSEKKLSFGFKVSIKKGIALGSGMGGSAASAVAAIVAANAFLAKSLSRDELLRYALVGESVASGAAHADNIAPCLYGGLTFTRVRDNQSSTSKKVEVTQVPFPKGLYCVLLHPHLQVSTKEARKLLKKEISLDQFVLQTANLAGFLTACFKNDQTLLRQSMNDVVIEPQRSHLVNSFEELKAAALKSGAIGASFSGSGPSLFAWAASKKEALKIEASMLKVLKNNKLKADLWVAPLSGKTIRGAHIL